MPRTHNQGRHNNSIPIPGETNSKEKPRFYLRANNTATVPFVPDTFSSPALCTCFSEHKQG